ncbi:MAG: pantetheine-phosphate adenylyltransferase [Erysipelotrichaceae bacterium]|jgi:pantetheine-phosphate adenylyltransferase|nr:pantetheine-phosphate adenylyltransferase [Erysipelotrichaceae bacterium]
MKACYPGTFDPITLGHLDIIERAALIFDELDVLLMVNPRKKCVFDAAQRKAMIEASLASRENCRNVKVIIGEGLTVDFARKTGSKAIVRGIRAVTDYEYELQQATANLMLDPDVETMFLIAKPEYSFLSSSVVKEIALNDGDISKMVPAEVVDLVKEAMADKKDVLKG